MKEMWLEVIFQMQRLMAGLKRKNPITGETIVGTWKATPVEDKVITKEGGGFAYKLPLLRKIQ